jgi:hypothetical protein
MHLALYLRLLEQAQTRLGDALDRVATAHADEPDILHLCRRLARQCRDHAARLRPFVEAYADQAPPEPTNLHSDVFGGPRKGGVGLLRDLQDLYVMAAECDICWTVVGQAAQGARDEGLLKVVQACEGETAAQLSWLRTRMKAAAPQALVVA